MGFLEAVLEWFADPRRWSGSNSIPVRSWDHLVISVFSTVVAAAIALPPALLLAHRRRAEFLANAAVNVGRAIPSFGAIVVAALFFARQGISLRFWPVVVALVLLALPPIFTNAYTAVREADPATVEAARGMGMSEGRVLWEIEMPMGASVILGGLRIAFVQVIATVPIAAIVSSGGGLGFYIVQGFAQGRGGRAQVFAGAVLVALLTVAADQLVGLAERRALPAGVRRLAAPDRMAETFHPA